MEPVVARLARTIDELAAQRRRMRREAEEDVVKLAVAIGRRILHRELTIDPEALLGVVKAALTKLERRELVRVRVHPAELTMVKRHFEQLDPSGPVEVVADAALERGGVVFETSRGNLDASLDTQLLEIQRGLSDRLGGGRQNG
jgi:flagellar assembly protein FliH